VAVYCRLSIFDLLLIGGTLVDLLTIANWATSIHSVARSDTPNRQ
jgi:hypothetical protein